MTDILLPETWPHDLDVDQYIKDHKTGFDSINLQEIPLYTVIEKLQLRGFLITLLENDPIKHTRLNLIKPLLTEIKRQAATLVTEYYRRVQNDPTMVNKRPLVFLSTYVQLKPPPVTVGMKTLEVGTKVPPL